VPKPYGQSVERCQVYVTEGWFEPTQGVWQDDPDFEDRPRKQLTRLPGDDVHYEAELPLTVDRDTVLFGVHHYRKDGEKVTVDSRDTIVLRGQSNCTVAEPVKLDFTLHTPGVLRRIWLSPVLSQVPLSGPPAVRFSPWEVQLKVGEGLPADHTFKPTVDLRHLLVAELVRENGAGTGLQMTVEFHPVYMSGPKVHFVPVLLTPFDSPSEEEALHALTEALAEETAKKTPDLFPLTPGSLPTFVKGLRNFSEADIPSKWFSFRRSDATVAALNDTLAASTFLDGAGRVAVVLRRKDFVSLFGEGAAGMTVDSSVHATPKGPQEKARLGQARTLSWKVMLMPSTETWDTVAHELLHTLPEGWAESEMKRECGRAYHNESLPIANGIRLTQDGVAGERQRRNALIPLMGPSTPQNELWITQCTYEHLTRELAAGPPDPPVLLVRAFVSQDGRKGELRPSYDLMGNSDLAPGKGGPWAFVLRDEKGLELGRYPFTPRFKDIETQTPRQMTSVVYRVPQLPGLARVELLGPGGVLDRQGRSVQAPTLRILAPSEGEKLTASQGKVRITWEGGALAGRTLLYSVSYSTNGGKDFLGQSFERKEASWDVRIDPKAKTHQVKVMATDGSRSAEVIIPLNLSSSP